MPRKYAKNFSCPLFKDMTNKRFGKLVAVRVDDAPPPKSRPGVWWICKCDCGALKSIPGKRLRDGSYRSCGCAKFDAGDKSHSWTGHKGISGKYWSQLQRNAHRRKIGFELTIQDAWNIFIKQGGKCALTGEPLSLHRPKTASLDRINSNKSYTKNNVQWTHIQVNKMKMDMDEKELLDWCSKIYKYANEKTT